MKRFIVFIIAFVLLFSISVPCFASDTSHGGGGGFRNDWTDEEKLEYYKYKGQKILHEITGIGRDNIAEDFLDRLYPFWDTRGYSSLEEYLLHELGYDEEQEAFVPSQNLTVDINNCIQEYNDSVTMTYRYPCNPSSVDASYFLSQNMYSEFIDVISSHPEYLFVITQQNMYDYPSYIEFYVIEVPFALVSGDPDLIYASCSLFNDNWITTFDCLRCRLLCDRYSYETSWVVMKNGSNTSFSSFDDINFSDYSHSRSGILGSFFMSENVTFSPSTANFAVSSCPSALNCYKSEADMKKDIGSQVIGSYSPNYTGSCVPSVDVNVINNYEIPDSGGGSGSGSGSDDNGGGSGGGVFDDIISGISSGVGSIIKGIFSIIKELVDAIADAIGSIVGSITDLMSLLNGNFTEFLSAVFPFMPSEFVSILVASVTLCMLGVIIKIFKG